MNSILSQIAKIAEIEGISIAALERSIGASKGVLSRAISNNTDIQSKWILLLIENYPQYNIEWLISGKGEMMAKYDTLENETKDKVNESEPEYSNYQQKYIEQLKAENQRLIKYSSMLENIIKEKQHIIDDIKSEAITPTTSESDKENGK